MIARTWHARAAAERAHLYPAHFVGVVLPKLRALPGFLGAYLLRRELGADAGAEVELVVQTLWADREAIGRFAGPTPDVSVVDADAEAMLVAHDATVTHHEVLYALPVPSLGAAAAGGAEDDRRRERAEIARLEAAIEREGARVGVDWAEAAPAMRTLAREAAPAAEPAVDGEEAASDEAFEVVLELDVTGMLATLRALPDHAGTAAFLAAFRQRQDDALPPS